jgi:hypothetical protein
MTLGNVMALGTLHRLGYNNNIFDVIEITCNHTYH